LNKTGVLLINLGTPRSPTPKDVYRYLIQFLTDKRVIDFSWLKRQCLVRGMIVPMRYRQSAGAYKKIWMDEGSPLLVYGEKVKQALQNSLEECRVELAMRYQQPSIEKGLERLMKDNPEHLIFVPLFPQYASSTTGSVHEEIMKQMSRYTVIPKMSFISEYASHSGMIEAFCARTREHNFMEYDHLLFSFHGLPERQVNRDLNKPLCYRSQCYATMDAIVSHLKIPPTMYSISFQSRLGKEPWLKPYTNETLLKLAQSGKKRVLVICPSFVCDCLETTYEISTEYANEFLHAGGEKLQLVTGLNDHPAWIDALKHIVESCRFPMRS